MAVSRAVVLLSLLFNQATARFAVKPISEREQAVHNYGHQLRARDVDPEDLYPAYNLTGVPIDHFHNDTFYEPHSNGTFNLRYWFDATYYKPGGPVIALMSGETSGEGRLPYLQNGIVYQLAKAVGGLGVILEHRYYGTSFPVPDLSVENLRFLTTDQSLADTAYFAKNVQFPGLNVSLTAPDTPWIVYGGSYAGAYVAFLRKLYPNVFWGAIGSSGVPEAIYDYWNYYEAVRKYGPQPCVSNTQKIVQVVDGILIGKNGTALVQQLKDVFGLGNVTNNVDFANTLSGGITGWQGRNWDPEVNDPSFDYYCGNLSSNATLYPTTQARASTVQSLISAAGFSNYTSSLLTPFLNAIGYVNTTVVTPCARSHMTQDMCTTNLNATFYQQDDIDQQGWRSWDWQVCTQWGYLQVGSTVPQDILPVVSRTIDIDYAAAVCRDAFGIYTPSNVTAINKYGGWNISYPRLAFIDGEVDPWREAGPHATQAPPRQGTVSEPYFLIQGAVHHWDENGRFPNETTPNLPPQPVRDAQTEERMAVEAWMAEWYLKQMDTENEFQIPMRKRAPSGGAKRRRSRFSKLQL